VSYWAVVLRTGDRPDDYYVYGPLCSKNNAERFAKYLTAEVDPAWALEVHSPMTELLNWYDRTAFQAGQSAEHWPPQPGDIWQGSGGERWACSAEQHARNGKPYLVCLAFAADDSAEEVARKYGPMMLVYRPDVREEEPPF
jgi:hypothetical protein